MRGNTWRGRDVGMLLALLAVWAALIGSYYVHPPARDLRGLEATTQCPSRIRNRVVSFVLLLDSTRSMIKVPRFVATAWLRPPALCKSVGRARGAVFTHTERERESVCFCVRNRRVRKIGDEKNKREKRYTPGIMTHEELKNAGACFDSFHEENNAGFLGAPAGDAACLAAAADAVEHASVWCFGALASAASAESSGVSAIRECLLRAYARPFAARGLAVPALDVPEKFLDTASSL